MHAYTSGHKHSLTVATAFAAGARAPLVQTSAGLQPGPVFTYGNLRGLKAILDQAIAAGRDWFYADNGYFRPGHYEGYYRVTRNAYQHDGSGAWGGERWERLGKKIMPWKKGGRFVMLCPPGDVYAALHDFDPAAWAAATLAELRQSTDREIVVRTKPGKGVAPASLWEALRECHALVTHSSNSAVEALLFGVPVFCTAPCAASVMGSSNLAQIEMPRYPEGRRQWACNLAANQWTLQEMRNGICWQHLTGGT